MQLLRLLPKCKQAFHTGCIDQWLESHSTCHLCRFHYNLKDFMDPALSESQLRFPGCPLNLSEDPNLKIFIQREQDEQEKPRLMIWKLEIATLAEATRGSL